MTNSPRSILERLAYASWLGVTGVSVIALIISLAMALSGTGLGMFIAGSGGFLLSRVIHDLGRRHLHFDECERTLEFRETGGLFSIDTEHDQRALSLQRALEEWNALDERGLTGEIDIWRRQALRRQVQSLLARDPELKKEFQEELRDHPDVG
jgi:hypothetical protein